MQFNTTTVPVLLEQRAARDPAGILIQEVGGKTYSNAEFHNSAVGVADGLAMMGVTRGDRVATLLDPHTWPYVLDGHSVVKSSRSSD